MARRNPAYVAVQNQNLRKFCQSEKNGPSLLVEIRSQEKGEGTKETTVTQALENLPETLPRGPLRKSRAN